MKVLLKEDVEKLGHAGDVVTVANGFARNFLLPRRLAVKASAGQVKQVDVIRRQAQVKRDRIAAEHAALAAKLNGIVLTFEANASERGRLYGSITPEAIAEALESRVGEPVDRRKLDVDPLRQVGLHTVPVRISANLIPEVQVVVHREGEDPLSYLQVDEEEEPAAEAEELAAEAEADEA